MSGPMKLFRNTFKNALHTENDLNTSSLMNMFACRHFTFCTCGSKKKYIDSNIVKKDAMQFLLIQCSEAIPFKNIINI